MATYAFSCAGCGPFELVRPIAEAPAGAACPVCGVEARRIYSPPALARTAAPLRRVLDAEHKSAHEPAVVSERRGRPMPHRHDPAPPWTVGH